MAAIYGIIGYPLGHSFSPAYFNNKFKQQHIDAEYASFPMPEIAALPDLLKSIPTLRGLNVTIPHKETVINYLNELDDTARSVGAVNCINIQESHTRGYNTDAIAFEQTLLPLLAPHHTRALVLGTGGASRAVTYVLRMLQIAYLMVSRTPAEHMLTYEDITAELIEQYPLIINTTPMGMFPNTASFPPLPYDALTKEHLLYDLVYNPKETVFLMKGKEQGATVKNGYRMLVLQAEASWRIWRGATS
jgi:shikimate dehydrogenase